MREHDKMRELRMGTAEAKFADMIWDNEPISSGNLAKLANQEFEWKKTTAFTVLKRLYEWGLFQNQNGTVTSLISKNEFYARHSQLYVEEAFGGSLPAFLAAFGTRKRLTDKEIDEIQRICMRNSIIAVLRIWPQSVSRRWWRRMWSWSGQTLH